MLSRRDFIRLSSVALCGLTAANSAFAGQVQFPPLGVQLYTVRQEAEGNLPQLLREIRAIGYQQVETYWNVYSHPAKELRQMIIDAELDVPSGHFDYAGLDGKFEYARELGVKYIVCPMLPKNMQNSLEGFQRAADQFNRWGEKARSLQMRFAFHNHNYEFQRFGQTTGFRTLVERTDPKLVCFEMDCYWITQAGEDPVVMMKKLGSRVRMLHLKDRKPGFPPSQRLNNAAEHFTEVGNGTIDWKKIFDTAREYNIEYKFVEQDKCDHSPIESLRISYRKVQDLVLESMGVVS
jgi:sugar phosphate isomerase/epimerase